MASQRFSIQLSFGRKLRSAVIALAAVTAFALFGQSPASDWQTAAGGKMAFDVASVKQNVSGASASNNLDWNDADPSTHTGGLFSATHFTLGFYIAFAYKLSFSREHLMEAELPKWATKVHFDVEARAPNSTTKDQMRLMMQSLLADRFKLAAHWEARQIPVYGLVLDKPGKRGPQLTPYSGGANCVASTASPPSAAAPSAGMTSDKWVMPCGDVGATRVNGEMHIGGRNLPMEQIANIMQGLSMGVLDRPVVDQTGLSGTFDLRIGFTREPNGPTPTNAQPPEVDAPGTSFLEALKEQLGLKLVQQTGPVEVLVIDHVEEPSEN
jgi:bla regulator protein BlaR1